MGSGIIADGDSITAGYNVAPTSAHYPDQAIVTLDPQNTLLNTAVPGYSSQDIINHLSAAVLPTLNAWGTDRVAKIYTLMIGTNDPGAGFTAAQTYSHIQSICSSVTATGASMVLFTMLPTSFASETYRQALNTLERTGGACTYTLSDVGNDSTIGQAGQNVPPYYQVDGTHPTAAGDTIIGVTYMRPAIQSLGVH